MSPVGAVDPAVALFAEYHKATHKSPPEGSEGTHQVCPAGDSKNAFEDPSDQDQAVVDLLVVKIIVVRPIQSILPRGA